MLKWDNSLSYRYEDLMSKQNICTHNTHNLSYLNENLIDNIKKLVCELGIIKNYDKKQKSSKDKLWFDKECARQKKTINYKLKLCEEK